MNPFKRDRNNWKNENGCRLNEKIGLQRMWTYNDTAWKI